MPTLKQLSIKGREQRRRRCLVPALGGSPHRRGVIYKMAVMSPRKPNSAKRRLAKVNIIVTGRRAFCHVPGLGQPQVQEYSVVMVEGGSPPDVPGVNYTLIRGLLDFDKAELYGRAKRRSKFGRKKII